MHVATIECTNCMHTLKQKVRTKEKREVRGIVDNNHIGLKNRQITRIRLGKKVTIKVGYIVLYNSVVFFENKSLFNRSPCSYYSCKRFKQVPTWVNADGI